MSEKTQSPGAIADLLSGEQARRGGGAKTALYRIGDLAAEFGLTLRSLRFYEDKGLLRPRRAGVTRLYDADDHARLRLIVFGRAIGFTLGEISRLIEFWEKGGLNATAFKALRLKLAARLTELEARRLEIDRTIEELRAVLSRMPSASNF